MERQGHRPRPRCVLEAARVTAFAAHAHSVVFCHRSMPDTDHQIATFRARCRAMREENCLEWDGIKLAPEFAQQADSSIAQPTEVSAQEQEIRRRREVRQTALRASGSLLPRLGDDASDYKR